MSAARSLIDDDADHKRLGRHHDRLPMSLAGPLLLAMSLLCWFVIWKVAQALF